MAETEALPGPDQPGSVFQFPWVRQLVMLAGLALAVAVGVVVALWSQEPNYTSLFNDLTERDALAVSEALRAEQVDFRIDERTGAVLVPRGKVHELRMRLAGQGLPGGSAIGMEVLRENSSLGTSRFVENARYKHALEAELGRSVSTLRNVESARVHLALPKQSVFIRKSVPPSASVVVKLYPGRSLEDAQVNAIVHMVASSIPQLEVGNVTVVDQMGRLLSQGDADQPFALTARQFDHTRRLENDYSERIVRLLEPLIGIGNVRAQVTASLDFTRLEATEESFDPERRAIRSEQINEQERRGGDGALGIPGALSNQPPAGGTTDAQGEAEPADGLAEPPTSQTRAATRNFEVDREIKHVLNPVGTITRLSVAVIIDDTAVRAANAAQAEAAGGQAAQGGEAADAAAEPQGYSEEELARFTALIRDAIGYDEARGDTVSLLGSSFLRPELEQLPEPPLWEQPWVWDLGKQVAGGLFVLLLLLFFVRPVIRNITAPPPLPAPERSKTAAAGGEGGELAEDQLRLAGDKPALPPVSAEDYEKQLEAARAVVKDDPARVAMLLKNWVAQDA